MANTLIFKKPSTTSNTLVFGEDSAVTTISGTASIPLDIITSGTCDLVDAFFSEITFNLLASGTGGILIKANSSYTFSVSSVGTGIKEDINAGYVTLDLPTTGNGSILITGSGSTTFSISSTGEDLSTDSNPSTNTIVPFGYTNTVGLVKHDHENSSVLFDSANDGVNFDLLGIAPYLTNTRSHKAFSSTGYISIPIEVDIKANSTLISCASTTDLSILPNKNPVAFTRSVVSSSTISTNTETTYSGTPFGVAHNGSNYIAFVEPNKLFSSADGKNWSDAGSFSLPDSKTFLSKVTRVTSTGVYVSHTVDWASPWFVNGKWFLIRDNILYTNPNSVPTSGWVTCSTPSSSDVAGQQKWVIDSIKFFNTQFRAYGTLRLAGSSITNHVSFVSSDGITWAIDDTFGDVTTTDFREPFVLGSYMLSVANGVSRTSSDGSTWVDIATDDSYPSDSYTGPIFFGSNVAYVSFDSALAKEIRVRNSTGYVHADYGASIANKGTSTIVVDLIVSSTGIIPIEGQGSYSITFTSTGNGIWTGGPEIFGDTTNTLKLSSTGSGRKYTTVYGASSSQLDLVSYSYGEVTYELEDIFGNAKETYLVFDTNSFAEIPQKELLIDKETPNKKEISIYLEIYALDDSGEYEIRKLESNSDFLRNYRYNKWNKNLVLGTSIKDTFSESTAKKNYTVDKTITQLKYGSSKIELTINISQTYRFINNKVNMLRLVDKEVDRALLDLKSMYSLEFE